MAIEKRRDRGHLPRQKTLPIHGTIQIADATTRNLMNPSKEHRIPNNKLHPMENGVQPSSIEKKQYTFNSREYFNDTSSIGIVLPTTKRIGMDLDLTIVLENQHRPALERGLFTINHGVI